MSADLRKQRVDQHVVDLPVGELESTYNIIARTTDTPQAIFISGFDSAPLAPDYDFIMENQQADFQAGIDVLKKLSDHIHIGLNNKAASKIFLNTTGVSLHRFQGPHPAGNVGVQIHHIRPINKGEKMWCIQPQEVATIGKLFTTGKHDFSRVMVVAGSEIKKPEYFRTTVGASVAPYLKDNLADGHIRIISGNVLTGTQIKDNGYLSFYDSQITAIPEGDDYELLGWALPGFDKFSTSRSFFSWLQPNKKYRINANTHGGRRAIVVSGDYESVLPMDVLPEQLIKSIMVEDIDKMEQLGIYELVEEDLALCEFICTSKVQLQSILRKGIDLMIKELGA